MMQVGVLGTSHKSSGLQLRDWMAKVADRRFGPGNSTHGAHTLVLLSTCNRTEVYFSSDDLAATHSYLLNILRDDIPAPFEHRLYAYFGNDCFLHLARVTAGLDSAVVAESEIQGQVKRAYEAAASFGTLTSCLHYLFQKSFRVAKEVRALLTTPGELPTVESVIVDTALSLLVQSQPIRVLCIGASEINRKVIDQLQKTSRVDIYCCNRSQDRAERIAEQAGITGLPWETFQRWRDFDLIVCATKCPDYLLNLDQKLPGETDAKLLIDLSVPRNIDPRLTKLPGITLLNIDQLGRIVSNRRHLSTHSLEAAEAVISERVDYYLEKAETRGQRYLGHGLLMRMT